MLETAVLERLATTAVTFSTPVIQSPAQGYGRDFGTAALYVTDVNSGTMSGFQHESLVGTIRQVRSTGGLGWVTPLGYDGELDWDRYVRTEGALVNPDPVNGHYYREFNATGEGMLLRYNDEDHREQRNIGHCPWSVVAGPNGAPWEFPNDGIGSMATRTYVEVEAPEVVAAPVPEPVTGTIIDEFTTVTMGKAQAEDDGTVLLNPEPAVGESYLLWEAGAGTPDMLVMGTYWGGDRFTSTGYWVRSTRTQTVTFTTSAMQDIPAPAVRRWAKAGFVAAERTTTPDQVSAMQSRLDTLMSKRADFNEALNQLAEDQSWCSEYEDVIRPLGIYEPRELKKDWAVEVTVTGRFTDDSPSSNFDGRIGNEYDLSGVEMTEVSFYGKARVTVYMSDLAEDDVRDAVDSGDVSDAFESISVDIDDWEIDEIREN